MPTGYTAKIKDGMTAKEFMTQCVRAMGVCIEMRDDPYDKEIPEKFTASTYHMEQLEKAVKEMEALNALSVAELEKSALTDYEEDMKRWKKTLDEKRKLRKNYEKILETVKAWEPPTDEHVGYKDFMIQQLTSSIDFDCDEKYVTKPVRMSGSAWKKIKEDSIQWSIDYHIKGQAEEDERIENRNTWLKEWRKSMKGVE